MAEQKSREQTNDGGGVVQPNSNAAQLPIRPHMVPVAVMSFRKPLHKLNIQFHLRAGDKVTNLRMPRLPTRVWRRNINGLIYGLAWYIW